MDLIVIMPLPGAQHLAGRGIQDGQGPTLTATDNQTVTVTITPDKAYNFLIARVEPAVCSGENPLSTNSTNKSQLVISEFQVTASLTVGARKSARAVG